MCPEMAVTRTFKIWNAYSFIFTFSGYETSNVIAKFNIYMGCYIPTGLKWVSRIVGCSVMVFVYKNSFLQLSEIGTKLLQTSRCNVDIL